MFEQNIFFLFIFSIILHNMEEVLWLPKWSKQAGRFHKSVDNSEFQFAVIVITLLACLSVTLFLFYPKILLFKYFLFGFIGVMFINVFLPHILATVILKKYAPGLITGIFLIIPTNSLIILNSVNNGIITLKEVIISTSVVGVMLISIIPALFKIGKRLLKEID